MKKIMFTKSLYVNDFSHCCLIIFNAIILNSDLVFNCGICLLLYTFLNCLRSQRINFIYFELKNNLMHDNPMTITVFDTGVIFMIVFITTVFHTLGQIDQVRLVSIGPSYFRKVEKANTFSAK